MRLFHIPITLLALVPVFADTHTLDKEKEAATLDTAAKEGTPLRSKIAVNDSVGVTAVLLTQPSVRRLFGSEISKTYAVVQLTISNKSADAAFVLHSAYIDTSQWALGGGTKGFSGPSNDTPPSESVRARSRSNSVASVEARIARGQLLDAQQWSARNWTIRLLTVAGSLASGYSFAFKETGIAKGIAAFNGNLVPGVAMAWPDGAVAQQNRISDFGYQTNKIIGKQSGDIVVCFFPIDMFLSPPIRQLFLTSPGLFLSPYQILFAGSDPGGANMKILGALGLADRVSDLRKLHPCYSKIFETPVTGQKDLLQAAEDEIIKVCKEKLERHPQALIDLDYIGRFGVQNIGIYVDGIMTVDIDTVPASIDQITFDADAAKPDLWAAAGVKTGTIQCRFCQSGQVSILEADKLGITDVTTVTNGSDDKHLKFSFKLTKAVEAGQPLTFVITKKSTDPKKSPQEVKSAAFVYTVTYVQTAASITKVTAADKKVTVTGSGFFNTKTNPLAIFLHEDKQEKTVPVTLSDTTAQDKLSFDLPAGLAPGCWNVQVTVGSAPTTSKDQILSEAVPKLTSATRKADSITVKGEQLVDTTGCHGKALTFQLLKAGQTKAIDVTSTLVSPSEATLALPADAKTGDWTVQVLQAGDVKSSVKLQ